MTGGLCLHPLCVEAMEKGHFPPVSQTYKTSGVSLMSDTSHPMLTSHKISTQAQDKQSNAI
eukprot:9910676-Ditylum_brightwellii.AAC.1